MQWQIQAEHSPLLDALTSDLDGTLAGPRALGRPRMHRKRFYRVTGQGEPALYVKIFSARRGIARLATALRRSKARREADTARRVAAAGFAVGEPVAVGEERCAGLLRRSISVVRELPLRDLRRALEDEPPEVARRRAIVTSFAALTREMHAGGIDQDDTSPNNFLLDDDLHWTLIDFERCRTGARMARRRWTLLAKLHRHDLGVSRSDRLRFLREYLGQGGDRQARRAAWERIRPEFRRVRRNDARRATRAAFRVGRNVGLEDGVWFVKGRENAATLRLSLDTAQCRAVWTLAHVFERLGLPALRPVRLARGFVDLLAPDLDEHAMEFHAAVDRARRRFAPYGTWVREPQWALTARGALLLTPTAFKLRL